MYIFHIIEKTSKNTTYIFHIFEKMSKNSRRGPNYLYSEITAMSNMASPFDIHKISLSIYSDWRTVKGKIQCKNRISIDLQNI